MPLNLGPTEERSRSGAVLVAIAILVTVAIGVFFLIPRRVAELSLQHLEVFAPHTEFTAMAGSTHVIGQVAQSQDDVYIVATVRITDKLHVPIFLDTAEATMTTSAGTAEATVISPRDIARLELSFPQLTPLAINPLQDGEEIAPGATREGTIILLFPTLTQDQWKAKQSANLTLKIAHQGSETITLP